jgi:hypothetical protein
MDERSSIGHGVVNGDVPRKLCPGHRKLGQIERLHRGLLSDDRSHCLAAEAGLALGENRLIGERGNDAKTILAGYILGRENANNTWMLRDKGLQIAESEQRAMVGTADSAGDQSIGRPFVCAEDFDPADLLDAVQASNSRTHRVACSRWEHRLGCNACIEHSPDDAAVPSAAAQHAPDRVHYFGFRGRRITFEQRGRRNQHARCADATLGRAMAKERGVQPFGMERIPGKSFDGYHLTSLHLTNRNQAAADRFTVEKYRAGAAIAGIASYFSPCLAEFFAQDFCETRRGR